jgi:hypothetical protein
LWGAERCWFSYRDWMANMMRTGGVGVIGVIVIVLVILFLVGVIKL